MTIVAATDSDGEEHRVWAQRQQSSCAVASIWMARSIVRQTSFAEEEWDLAWRLYGQVSQANALRQRRPGGPSPSGPMTLDSRSPQLQNNQKSFANMFASFGTLATQVATLLRSEDISVTPVPQQWQAPRLAGGSIQGGVAVDAARLATDKPAIVLIGWYRVIGGSSLASGGIGGELRRNGGHFVVAARQASSGQIVYLDPWGGVLYERTNNRRYGNSGLIEQVLYLAP